MAYKVPKLHSIHYFHDPKNKNLTLPVIQVQIMNTKKDFETL